MIRIIKHCTLPSSKFQIASFLHLSPASGRIIDANISVFKFHNMSLRIQVVLYSNIPSRYAHRLEKYHAAAAETLPYISPAKVITGPPSGMAA